MDIIEADIENNNYDEQFKFLLTTDPSPSIATLNSIFPYFQEHWNGVNYQSFAEDHPTICTYYETLLFKQHDIFQSSSDYQLHQTYIPLIYPNITFNHYLPHPIHSTLWDSVYTLPASSRPNTYEELLHYATVNLLPLPVPPSKYDEIQDPSVPEEDEDSEENFATYDDPDPDDADLGDNNETALDDDDGEDVDPDIDDAS